MSGYSFTNEKGNACTLIPAQLLKMTIQPQLDLSHVKMSGLNNRYG